MGIDVMENIKKLLQEDGCMTEGRRNNDAVNLCIYFYVLELDRDDQDIIIEKFANEDFDHDYWEDKREVVEGYLPAWGPEGKREQALSFVID